MKRAIAYVRVSTRQQGESGFGLQSQEAEVRGFASAVGYRLMAVHRDVASAVDRDSHRRRPGLQAAIEEARRRGWPIIVSRLDRLCRTVEEAEKLIAGSGVKIISARNGPDADPVVMATEAARVAKETQMLKERTREGLRRAKQQGKMLGNRKNLAEAQRKGAEANQRRAEQSLRILEPLITDIRRSGASTGVEIAGDLNARGILTSRGQPWTSANLRRILREIDERARQRAENDLENRRNPSWGLF